jgi:hypothetical protein
VMLEIRCCGKKGFLGHQAAVVGAKRQERNYARPLDGARQCSLVAGAVARLTAGVNLEPVGKISPQPAHVLVVDVLYLVNAKGADLTSGNVTASWPAARSTTWSAAWSKGGSCHLLIVSSI